MVKIETTVRAHSQAVTQGTKIQHTGPHLLQGAAEYNYPCKPAQKDRLPSLQSQRTPDGLDCAQDGVIKSVWECSLMDGTNEAEGFC